MISIVPPVIGLTILLSIGILAAQSANETAVSEELARDMLRHHQHHYDAARSAGFPIGVIEADLPYPLQPLAVWHSEVVQEGMSRKVLTWAEDYGADGFETSVYRAVVSALPRKIGQNGIVGVIVFPGAGGPHIGVKELPFTISPISAGSPAIYR